jgi:hypothetical protein
MGDEHLEPSRVHEADSIEIDDDNRRVGSLGFGQTLLEQRSCGDVDLALYNKDQGVIAPNDVDLERLHRHGGRTKSAPTLTRRRSSSRRFYADRGPIGGGNGDPYDKSLLIKDSIGSKLTFARASSCRPWR